MKRLVQMIVLMVSVGISVVVAGAAQVKVQVCEFTVAGVANKDELKGSLHALLSSRLGSATVLIVDDGAAAAAKVNGSYSTFGKNFSIDATVKNAAGDLLGRTYVQGEGQDDLIPAIGRLAEQLRPLLGQPTPLAAVATAAVPVAMMPVVAPPVAAVLAPASPRPDVPTPTKTELVVAPAGDIVRTAPAGQPAVQQKRIEGALLGIAPGRALATGERELLLADSKRVYLYHKGIELKKVANFAIKGEGKILGIDTADADGDGQLEAYVTVMDREELVSLALAITEQGFTVIAEQLPYYFRALAVYGREKRLYVQQMSTSDDFYGPVCEAVKKGNVYSRGTPVKLPAYANIYTFNRLAAADGTMATVVIDRDGNLRVLDEAGKELWQGNERFGGSEVYFQRDEQQMQPLALDRYRWRFVEQRIEVAPNGEIIVPRNGGLLVIGNSRSYSKNSVYGFAWNGAALEERWHTQDSANYLADFFYDASSKELVLLEQVQKEGLISKGASVIVLKKVE